MNRLKPEVNVYFESENQLLKTNCDYRLIDGKVIHWQPSGEITYLELPINGDITIDGDFEFNKIMLYFLPKNSFFGETSSETIFKIYYFDDTGWHQLFFTEFNSLINLEPVYQPIPGRYKAKIGIAHLWRRNLNCIRATKLKFYFPNGGKITEIIVSKLVKRNPLNIRFNEARSIDDEYKGIEVNTTFFDGDFEIKNTTFYNQKVYLEIKSDNKTKMYSNLLVDKIYTDVKERITNIYLKDVFSNLKERFVDVNTEVYFNEEVSKILELLLLEGNIHSDLLDIKVVGKTDYYPRYTNLYDEVLEVIKSNGDILLGLYNNRITIKSRSETTPIILSQGSNKRLKNVVKKGVDSLARIEFNEVFVANFDFENSPIGAKKYRVIDEVNNYLWIQDGDKYKLKILTGGYVILENFLFIKETENYYYELGRTIFDVYPGQQVNVDFLFKVDNVDYVLDLSYEHNGSFPTAIEFRLIGIYEKFSDEVDVFGQIIDINTGEKIDENFILNIQGFITELKSKIYSSNNDLEFSYFITGMGLPCEIRDENNNLVKDGFGFIYEFDTPDAYLYNTFYLNENNFDFITSLSSTDSEIKLVENGVVKSSPGNKIKFYLYERADGQSAVYRYDFDIEITIGGVYLRNFWVSYLEDLVFFDKANLTYYTEQAQDIEIGVVDVLPKEIKLMKSTKFYTEDVIFNRIVIGIQNWVKKENEIVFKDKTPIVIKENSYYVSSILNDVVDKNSNYQLEVDIQGVGTRIYSEGETIDNDLSWVVNYKQKTLSVEIYIYPIDKNVIRTITRLEVRATIFRNENIVSKEFVDRQSIIKYGEKQKQVEARYITNDIQLRNIVKKYFRFSTLPVEIIGDEIYTFLNLDVNFFMYGKIYDEIQNRIYLFKIFEYEHYIDIGNGTFDTIIRGRLISYDDYARYVNYWGNGEYFGGLPPKYWGGNYE